MENSGGIVLKRDVFDEIVKYLDTNNILVLHGARQVGKTNILFYLEKYLQEHRRRWHYLDLEDSRLVEMMDQGIDSFLSYLSKEGLLTDKNEKLFVLIDEIQYLASPSPFLKLLADHHPYLQLIVSGSSSFDIRSKFSDSLVGRTVEFEIFPLSFSEFLRFKNAKLSLKDKALALYREFVNFGGYPKVVLEESIERKEKYLQQIIDTYVRKDINDLAQIKDIQKFNDLLKLLASQSGQLLNISQLANIVGVAQSTIENYLFILESTYILKLVSPYSSSAKVEVVKSPKVFFYDTGLLKMLWLKNLSAEIAGNVLETSVFSELVKKYGRQNINFWRNKSDNEIDFILQKDGGILPIEVKTNFNYFHQKSLDPFCQKYHVEDYRVVALDGQKTSEKFIYPWEL